MKPGFFLHIFCASVACAVYLLGHPAFAQAAKEGCTCDFADSKWEAYGTKAACATYMHKGRTSCNIEFAGISANPNLVKSVLGFDPTKYRNETYKFAASYIALLENGKRSDLSDPKFLAQGLAMIMRGAYLRGPADDKAVSDLKILDNEVTQFLEKYTVTVSDVFLGRKPPFKVVVGKATFDVQRGNIIVDEPNGHLLVVYLPPG